MNGDRSSGGYSTDGPEADANAKRCAKYSGKAAAAFFPACNLRNDELAKYLNGIKIAHPIPR